MIKIRSILLKIKKIFFSLSYKIKRFFRILLKIDQKMIIGNKKLLMPPEHNLSWYNIIYKEYDKYLPSLVSQISKNSSVIDIGANIGDTVYRMLDSNPNLKYYCVEADDYFYGYLKRNKELLNENLKERVILINELVGENIKGILHKSEGGTATLIEKEDGIKSKTLDQIIDEYKIKDIKLIKSDIDGYDYNALNSGMNEIENNKPDLFFECATLQQNSHEGFVSIIKKLEKIGYKNWSILDNYGIVIFEKRKSTDVLNFLDRRKGDEFAIDIFCKEN
tara:strand:- start:125 stop:958 length:834 start_codon:yes stop_codon:yes gene_type:complete